MCLLNSYCFYPIFHLFSLILWSFEGNAGLISEPKSKQLISINTADYENVARESTYSEMRNSQNENFQSSIPEPIADVETQIIRELQKMVKSNLEGSEDAANALTETVTCMKNGMPFSDALHEGLRKMFPNIIGLQDSTSNDGAVVAIILFTNMRKYMQDVYILNLLRHRQQTKEYENADKQLSSSTDTNVLSAGNHQSGQSHNAKQATMQINSDNIESERADATTGGKSLLASRKNGSDQLASLQNSAPKPQLGKPQLGPKQTNVSSLSIPQPCNDFSKNNFGQQERNVSGQAPTPQMSAGFSKMQLGHMQSGALNQSAINQSTNNSATKNQFELQQNKSTRNISSEKQQNKSTRSISGESTQKKLEILEKPQPLEEGKVKVASNSNIKSDIADLSGSINRWMLIMQESQRRFQASNSSSMKTAEEKQINVLDTKKEEKTLAVGNREVSMETPSSQSRLKIPQQNQQFKRSNGPAGGPSAQKIVQETKESQLSGGETVIKNSSCVAQKNQEKTQVKGVKMKPALNQSSGPVKIKEPKRVVQSPNVDFAKKISESEGALIQDMSDTTGRYASPERLGQQAPKSGPSEAEVPSSGRPRQQIPRSGPKAEVFPERLGQQMPQSGKAEASPRKLVQQTPQSGPGKADKAQSPTQDEVIASQKENLKRLMSSTKVLQQLNEINQYDTGTSVDRFDRMQSNSENFHIQKGEAEYYDSLDDQSIPSADTNPEENVTYSTKRQAFRSETPSIRPHTVIIGPSEPVRETIQYGNVAYGGREEYVGGYSGVYEDRSNFKGIGYGGSNKNGGYEELENEEYGTGKKITMGQPESNNILATGTYNEASGSASASKSNLSQSWFSLKPTAILPYKRLTNESAIKSPQNAETMVRAEEGGSPDNSDIIDKLMESISQPGNGKWQRRVIKIVDEEKAPGQIVRKISRSGDWSPIMGSASFKESTPKERSKNTSFGQQREKNQVFGIGDEISREKKSIQTNNTDELWQFLQSDDEIAQNSLISIPDENVIPKLQGFQKNTSNARRFIFGHSGFESSSK